MALKICSNPFRVFKKLQQLRSWYDLTFYENIGIRKIYRSQDRYFFRLHVPGWPSEAYKKLMRAELEEVFGVRHRGSMLQFIIFAITKQCPLRCMHCSEWDRMRTPNEMSVERLKGILQYYQDSGVSQILLSGGEPMTMVDQIPELISDSHEKIDYWILSSGYNLTPENVEKIKTAGVTGVFISIDHWLPEKHNTFRDNGRSFKWASEAAENVKKAGLLLCLSICATKEFVSTENLWQYAGMAKQMNAQFIQLLDPKQAGRFKQRDIDLSQQQIEEIEQFYRDINSKSAYRDWPVVLYGGYSMRRTGCFGGGKRFLFIDTNGDVHSCPFCESTTCEACTKDIKKPAFYSTLQISQ